MGSNTVSSHFILGIHGTKALVWEAMLNSYSVKRVAFIYSLPCGKSEAPRVTKMVEVEINLKASPLWEQKGKLEKWCLPHDRCCRTSASQRDALFSIAEQWNH